MELLFQRKFWPLFWTQFFGAFNDNVFKNALIVLITFKSYSLGFLDYKSMAAFAAGLFILPFFLFSAMAGQITDKYSKSKVAKYVKVWELFAMCIGACGFIFENVPLLLVTLFFMGMQSSFFGPVKYSILPELLDEDELVKGNAYVEAGTFVSIPLGTIVGGFGVMISGGQVAIGFLVIIFALIGLLASYFIPYQKPQGSTTKIDKNFFSSTYSILKLSKKDKSIFWAIMGISWFWLIGAVLLTIIPSYCKDNLNASPALVSMILATFSVGVGVGSILSEKISKGRIELGILFLSSLGMSIFMLDLFLIGTPAEFFEYDTLIGIEEILRSTIGYRVILDFFLLAACGGIFIVPLYTLLQVNSNPKERACVIAANNVWNSFYIVGASLLLMAIYSFGYNNIHVFIIYASANFVFACLVYYGLPEHFWTFTSSVMARIFYRFKTSGKENIPNKGAAILVANHISFIDWLLIAAASNRPIRFVMHNDYFNIPFSGFFFRHNKVIPITMPNESRKIFLNSFKLIQKELDDGQLVCLFPEGEISRTGDMNDFKRGVEKILEKNPVPVIPLAINGMWGSFFSRKYGAACSKPFKRFYSKISIDVGKPIDAEDVTVELLQKKVTELCNK